MNSLISWESSLLMRDSWDVGISSVLIEGKIVGWKLIFLIADFNPNNVENWYATENKLNLGCDSLN